MKYYDLTNQGYDNEQWVVSIPPVLPGATEWWDVWAFARCERYRGHAPIQGEEYDGPGRRTAFTSCEFNCFVVSEEMGELLLSVAPEYLELVPIVIDGESEGEWYILNILDRVECIDFKRSKVEWGLRDGRETIVNVYHLEIEEEKAAGHDIFRLGEFPVQVLVSERMAQAMKESGLDGFRLAPLPWDTLWN